jgi:hypothetical protein
MLTEKSPVLFKSILVGFTVIVHLGLNSFLNLFNKYILGPYGFSYPVLLTCSHMMFSFWAVLPLMLRRKALRKHEDTIEKQWKGIVAVGLFMALNISLNNASLVEMTLSLNQIIRYHIICLIALSEAPLTPKKLAYVSIDGMHTVQPFELCERKRNWFISLT